LEIAAIVGAALEAVALGLAVVADGFISTVAVAAAALTQDEALARAVFFSHRSVEVGHTLALDLCASLLHVDARPLLDLEMRLGEGSGAALAMPLLRSAAAVMREMATFESAGVSAGENAEAHGGQELA
jgi:nicotinate-nucleotide--dimethylbenzimidazole phosphoribosyltransferase